MCNSREEAILKEMVVRFRLGMIDKFYPSETREKDVRFTPAKIIDFFERAGFSCDYREENGWEQDTWYSIDKDDIHLTLYYSGYYFTMMIALKKDEDKEEE